MNVIQIVKIALKSMMRNKMRSMLTMLGIIIGVGAVIGMMAITQGASRSIMSSIRSMGDNVLFVYTITAQRQGRRIAIREFKPSDLAAITRYCPHIKYLSPESNAVVTAVYKNRNWQTNLVGGNEYFPLIRSYKIQSGTFYASGEVQSGAKVCVVGSQVRDMLFDRDEDPVGKTIRLNKVPFKIIGVMAEKGSASDQSMDDIIIAPYKTVVQRFSRNERIFFFQASATSEDNMEKAQNELTDILRQLRRIPEGGEDDFGVFSQEAIIEFVGKFVNTMTLLLGSVAAVSLLVGGIGIMNIMLVSVTERIREIGIRMAIGAKAADILNQFLIESAVISIIGGIMGIGFGWLIALIAKNVTQWDAVITPGSVALAFFFSMFIGVFFGFYPAWKASKLDPIVALRHE